MRSMLLIYVVMVPTGCFSVDTSQRKMIRQNIEGYAIASCLTYQEFPYLQDQGDAWASVILQRMDEDIGVFSNISEIVKDEMAKGEMAFMRSEGVTAKDKALPVLYCNELIYKTSVQSALTELLKEWMSNYRTSVVNNTDSASSDKH